MSPLRCSRLAVSLLCLALPLLAHAGYPSDNEYVCSWSMGSLAGRATVLMNTSGSSWLSGTLVTRYANGQTASTSIQLTNPSSVLGGKGSLWRFRDVASNNVCEFYSIANGTELVWKNCTNGAFQHCAAVDTRVQQNMSAASCNCQGRTGAALLQCMADCAAQRFRDAAAAACTQDLVSMVKCFSIWASTGGYRCDDANRDGRSDSTGELCYPTLHTQDWFYSGNTCMESTDCFAGNFCFHRSFGGICRPLMVDQETGDPITGD